MTSRLFRSALKIAGPFLGLLFVLGLFRVVYGDEFTGPFLSSRNLQTVLVQTVIVAVGAIGMTFVVAAGGIDLSVGSSLALSSVVTAKLLKAGCSPWQALVGGVLSGGAVGLANGVLTVGLRITPFITTLGMMQIARGVAKAVAGEQKVDAPENWLPLLVRKDPEPAYLLVAPAVWIAAILAVLMSFVLRRGVLGLRATAVGSNEATARLCGVPVGRTKILVYLVSGLCTGLAGVLYFARVQVGDPTAAVGEELPVIAAVVIGGASLSGGTGSIGGALLGALVMAVLKNGCNLVELPNYVQEIVVGAVIVAAVAVDRFRKA